MKLGIKDFQELLSIGENAAIKAGKIIQSMSQDFKVLGNKDVGSTEASSVLTEVDILSQKSILSDLNGSITKYDLGILAEEEADNNSRFIKDYFWCIDPMDGTLPFINGNHGYSVTITLISKEGIPYIGIVYDPVKKNLYSSIKGCGVKKNGFSLTLPSQSNNLTFIYDNSFLKSPIYRKTVWNLEQICKEHGYNELMHINNKGAVLNAISIFENSPSIYFKFKKTQLGGGAIWDFAATALFFSELKAYGFKISDAAGKPLNFNRKKSIYFNGSGIIYSSNAILQKEIIRLQNSITTGSI